MKPLQIAQDIIPISAFKSQASQVLRAMHDTGRPVVLTQNGRPAAVLVSTEDFDRMTERERLIAAVERGQAEIAAGLGISDEDLGHELDAEFGPLQT